MDLSLPEEMLSMILDHKLRSDLDDLIQALRNEDDSSELRPLPANDSPYDPFSLARGSLLLLTIVTPIVERHFKEMDVIRAEIEAQLDAQARRSFVHRAVLMYHNDPWTDKAGERLRLSKTVLCILRRCVGRLLRHQRLYAHIQGTHHLRQLSIRVSATQEPTAHNPKLAGESPPSKDLKPVAGDMERPGGETRPMPINQHDDSLASDVAFDSETADLLDIISTDRLAPAWEEDGVIPASK